MYNKEHSTVRVAIDVSFQVGNMNYGTITVPKGTKVFRHHVDGKISDWFIEHDDMVKLCPKNFIHEGKISQFYLHDASHYGITVPNANVGKIVETPKKVHSSFHY
jgi:hypothetical protein